MKIYILIISLFLLNRFTVAQQAMTLKNCEERFIQSNLSLLAEQYNISISKAEVIQAKIWDLPYFSGEINALDPQNNRAFHINNSGQKAFNVQQLIYLGGKKKKEVEFAKSNVTLAELQFEQLLRNLKFQLYDNFYSIYFNNYKIQKINFQIENLDTLINYYSSQEKKGNIPLKDVVRLKSLANSFKGQMIDLQNKVLSYQENLKIILNLENKIEPIISEEDVSKILAKPILQSEEELKKTALLKNPDYLYKTKIK